MKHYMDISRIKQSGESELTEDNTKCFEVGDRIQISEKVDGANASIALDNDGSLVAYSRKNELNATNNLRGFWNYVQTLDKNQFADLGNMVCYGEWLCLSGDTVIRKTSAGKNQNYMTLREMYKFLNTPTPDKYHYNPYTGNHSVLSFLNKKNGLTFEELLCLYKQHNEVKKWTYESSLNRILNYNIKRDYIMINDQKYYITDSGKYEIEDYGIRNNWWNRYGMPSIFSLYHDQDVILSNQIKNIVYTGDKTVFELKTRSGFTIKSTADHKFYTPHGYKALKDLKINDCVGVTDFYNHRKGRALGNGSRQNQKKQEKYKVSIGHCERCGSTDELHLHHKNRNWQDNDVSNWEVLCQKCHMEEHKNDHKFNGVKYTYYYDNIVSIQEVGIEDCYDIEMIGDENCANFIANGFIVHNCKHTVKYSPESYNKWYVYDMYDKDTEKWLPQEFVKQFAESHGLIYIHVLYDGPFVSWEHCRTFCNSPAYGERQEGIVVKSQTKLNDPNNRQPFYLKIVNDSFKETQLKNHVKKVLDPQHIEEQQAANESAEQLVTKARVLKEIHKMIDEGILPEKLQPKDMGVIAKNLPKRIFDDVVKEESEHLDIGNQYIGKAINNIAMKYAREIVTGE